jgi:hypothetical protein
MKKLGVIAALAALGVLAYSGVSTGSDSDEKRSLNATAEKLAVHRVESPSDRAATATRARSVSNVRTAYYQTDPFPVAASGVVEVIVQCPKKWKVVSGYFQTTGGIVPDGQAVQSARRMFFGLINLTSTPGQAYVGLVCQQVAK